MTNPKLPSGGGSYTRNKGKLVLKQKPTVQPNLQKEQPPKTAPKEEA